MNTIDKLSIDTIRVLSAEAIQKANSGHPGMPIGAAPIAYAIWKNMNHSGRVYMDNFDENGYPIIDENSEIYPLTLLVDDSMLDDVIKLTVPTIDGDNAILINVNVPKFEYV